MFAMSGTDGWTANEVNKRAELLEGMKVGKHIPEPVASLLLRVLPKLEPNINCAV